MKEICSFVGPMGSGKTYLALEEIQRQKSIGKSVLMISWADPIKQMLLDIFGITKNEKINDKLFKIVTADDNKFLDTLYNYLLDVAEDAGIIINAKISHTLSKNMQKNLSSLFDIIVSIDKLNDNHGYKELYRELIQIVGTELGRGVHQDIWIKTVLTRINNVFLYNIAQVVVIDDTRFFNEYDELRHFSKSQKIELSVFGVKTPIETRAKRLDIPVEVLKTLSKHSSESEIPEIITKIDTNNLILNH